LGKQQRPREAEPLSRRAVADTKFEVSQTNSYKVIEVFQSHSSEIIAWNI